jgi:hypothetical protein
MKSIKGETGFKEKQNEVITTFVSNEKDKVVVTFDTTDKLNLKMSNVKIEENGSVKEYNKDILNTIPEEWTDVLNCMESLTVWFKLDTKE